MATVKELSLCIKLNSEQHDQIKSFKTNLFKTPKARITQSYLESRRELLIEYWKRFTDRHNEIVSLSDQPRENVHYFCDDVFGTTEDLYLDCMTYLNEKLHEINPLIQPTPDIPAPGSPITQTTTTEQINHNDLPLPRLSLPKFDGNYHNWPSFYDLFKCMIHDKSSIPPVQKLQYLKGHLIGEAEKLIRHFQVTQANYEPAWYMLTHRYNNKRLLVNHQLTTLYDQPKIHIDTAVNIKKLLDTTTECLHNIRNLDINTDHWDPIIIYMITKRLSPESHTLWEQSLKDVRDIPTFDQITSFLETRYRTLEAVSANTRTSNPTNSKPQFPIKTQSYTITASVKCCFCGELHSLRQCPVFLSKEIQARFRLVKEKSLCINCLSPSHTVTHCKSSFNCTKCRKRHHTLLHFAQNSNSNINLISQSSENAPANVLAQSHHINPIQNKQVLLATALVKLTSANGHEIFVRALVDQGSQGSFITERACQLLQLTKQPINLKVSGIGATEAAMSNHQVNFVLNSRFNNNFSASINAYVLTTLTGIIPFARIPYGSWEHTKDLILADPTFHEPGKIDLLLGADIFSAFIMDGLLRGSEGTPIAQNTKLGWILSGQISQQPLVSNKLCHSVSFTVQTSLMDQLKQFWELEEIPSPKLLTKTEQRCEEIFEKTVRRAEDGRFITSLPFKEQFGQDIFLGRSRSLALVRFNNLEKTFARKPELQKQYSKCIQEYLDLDQMELIKNSEDDLVNIDKPDQINGCYLPHHAVVREASLTTKLRVVFDPSTPTSSSISLNECLLVGPRLQDDLFDILTRFRTYPIAFTADITKMYRQILLDENDRNYHRILWRSNVDEPIKEYRMNRVTFGVASSPHTAVKTIQHLSRIYTHQYPLAAEAIQNDFYVDDCVSGANSSEEASIKKQQIIDVLKKGGFDITKWNSNDSNLHDASTESNQSNAISFNKDDSIKTLGIYWQSSTDNFQFKISLPPDPVKLTKRTLLSDIAKVFDPIGLLSPVTIRAKILLQQLWLIGSDWDDKLPENIITIWHTYRKELPLIETLNIPRWVGYHQHYRNIQIHCFSDASEKAFSAAIYIRTENSTTGIISTSLLASRTRVAPLKRVSLPRLELCGAVLGANLAKTIIKSLKIENFQLFAWSDSSIVIAWLKGEPSRWKTFVANRVTEIHQVLDPSTWHHIKSEDNPADCASRGISPSELIQHHLWWTGPPWLKNPLPTWPTSVPEIATTTIEEKKIKSLHIMNSIHSTISTLIQNSSSFTKLIRSTAYIFRFIKNAKTKTNKTTGWLSTIELSNATNFLITHIQNEHFSIEISNLRKKMPTNSKSKLHCLNPFIDIDNIIKVGGRLQHSPKSSTFKHPIILPNKSHFTLLLINHLHTITLHGGPQVVITISRQKYWILNARNTIRHQLHKCVKCHRYRAQFQTQLMGQLPTQRVSEPSKPFLHTGVDYAGPFDIKCNRTRNSKFFKGYLCLFVCMATRAIHLELATDLTSSAFISAFKNFISRRGRCYNLYSDNGTNFVGAAKCLNQDVQKANMATEIADILANDGVKWNFISPGSPHHGGLWEAGVKSAKFHLKRVLGDTKLVFEEFQSLIIQIEAILNSRPIQPLTSDPNDLEALTPGHFLIGEPVISFPEPNLLMINENRLDIYHKIQRIKQSFWKRWNVEYVHQMQQRPKWAIQQPNLQVGDLVLIKHDNMPPSKWLLGRITQTHPGKDGLVRTATLKTINGSLKRPITKLSLLPIANSPSNTPIST